MLNWDCAAEAHFKRGRIELAQLTLLRDNDVMGTVAEPVVLCPASHNSVSFVIASAGLLLAASIPLARSAHRSCDYRHRCGNRGLNTSHEVDTLWIILGARALSLTASSLGLIH